LQGATIVSGEASQPARLVLAETPGTSAIRTIVAWPDTPYHVAARIRTEDVHAVSAQGYAYAAIYEFDETGELLCFQDFAQVTGSRDWTDFKTEGTTHPRTVYLELRLGLHEATGKVWIEPPRFHWAKEGDATATSKDAPGPANVALILWEPEFPSNPATPDPRLLSDWLAQAGYRPRYLQAKALMTAAACEELAAEAALLVLPNGPCFPIAARPGLLSLLSRGIDLLSLGGYPLDRPLRRTETGWETVDLSQPTKVRLLNRDPGFETSPAPGATPSWHDASGSPCPTTTSGAAEGSRCAVIDSSSGDGQAIVQTVADVRPGQRLRLSGYLKTAGVREEGYAFLAVYPMAGNEWRSPQDIAQVRGTQDWGHWVREFLVPLGVDRVDVRFGLYRASGTAYFDDVRLEEVEYAPRLNTRHGEPQDGLIITPWQLGMCDADYPLRRVARLTAPGWQAAATATGHSAVGVLRTNARWMPLVQAEDRFGRACGTAGAMMIHREGLFTGSAWTFFGVDNLDLTQLPGFADRVLLPTLRRMRRGVYLTKGTSHLACYRPGEAAELACSAQNFGTDAFDGTITWQQSSEDSHSVLGAGEKTIRLNPGEAATWTIPLDGPSPPGLHRVTIHLDDTMGNTWDKLDTGFMVWDGKALPQSQRFAYSDNYFHWSGRPAFLCGTTTWSNWFFSPSQSDPLFWARELSRMADYGIAVNANLQSWWHPPYELTEADWRKMDAAVYLSHRAGVIYRAGLFIGQDVAVEDSLLEQQVRLAAAFAQRYRQADGLIYYLNGDYQLRPKSAEQTNLPWQLAQTRHWNERLTTAIRESDPDHPVISEYYQHPNGGLDVRRTLDGLSMAEIGYFDRPGRDLRRFPAVFKLTDHRLRGKSAAIGEFGVKTHPAWDLSLGGSGYHIRRSMEQQNRLFLLIPQVTFGLGGATARNWCWRDDDDRVFPWGLTYTCDGVPRDALRFYRAAALLLLRLQPQWRKPEVLLVAADGARQTVHDDFSPDDLAAADVLTRLGIDFAVVSDLDLREDDLLGAKVAFVPGETVSEAAARILATAEKAGRLSVCWEHPTQSAPSTEPTPEAEFVVQPGLPSRWARLLDKAGVARVRLDPDDLALITLPVPLQDGLALVLANPTPQPRSFTAQTPDGKSVQMTLASWEPGLVAWDTAGKIVALEGGQHLLCDGQPLADSDGHLILWSTPSPQGKNNDLRAADEVFLIATTAGDARISRTSAATDLAELGEFRQGQWHRLEAMPVRQSNAAIHLQIPVDCRAELIRIRRP